MTVDRVIADLIDGKLDGETLRLIQRLPKETDRFEKVLEAEQAQLGWEEEVLLPLQAHLFVIRKSGGAKIIKCSCGFEFCDPRENWKYRAMVYERNSSDGEVYSAENACNPLWMIIREFFCPGCWTQLEVEAVPPGHPFIWSYSIDEGSITNSIQKEGTK